MWLDMNVAGGVADSRHADFDEVYRRELVPVAAVAIALTGDRETGVDLTHEAMLRAYKGLGARRRSRPARRLDPSCGDQPGAGSTSATTS